MTNFQYPFIDLFQETNENFGDYYIDFGIEEIKSFFLSDRSKRKPFIHLLFFSESLVTLRKSFSNKYKGEELKIGNMSHIYADKLWYSSYLLILIGLIQQEYRTKFPHDIFTCACGKKQKLKSEFVDAMNLLSEETQDYFVRTYRSGEFKNYTEVCESIYGDRNYFAHEIERLDTPSPLGISYDLKPGSIEMRINMKQEEILLNIVIALFKSMGFEGKLMVCTSKEYKNLSDVL